MSPDVLLNKSAVVATPLTTGATQIIDQYCQSRSVLTVQADLNGAANGDLTVTVVPYEEDGVTLSGVSIDPVRSKGPTFAVSKVTYWGQYNVEGFTKVQVQIKNNNAGTQTLNRATTFVDSLS